MLECATRNAPAPIVIHWGKPFLGILVTLCEMSSVGISYPTGQAGEQANNRLG